MLNYKTYGQWLLMPHLLGKWLIWFCLLPALILASCGSDEETTPTPVPNPLAVPVSSVPFNVTILDVVVNDSYYGTENTNLTTPPVWKVFAGEDILVNIENRGRLTHNWAIVKPGVTVPVPYDEGQGGDILLHGVGMVYGHNQTMATVSGLPQGEYLVICTVSGHYPLMQGRLVVTDK